MFHHSRYLLISNIVALWFVFLIGEGVLHVLCVLAFAFPLSFSFFPFSTFSPFSSFPLPSFPFFSSLFCTYIYSLCNSKLSIFNMFLISFSRIFCDNVISPNWQPVPSLDSKAQPYDNIASVRTDRMFKDKNSNGIVTVNPLMYAI